MNAITYFFLDQPYNINPPKEIFLEIINIIENTNFIKTCVEVPPLDTILYKNNNEEVKKSLSK